MGDINQSLLDNIFIQRILLLEPILLYLISNQFSNLRLPKVSINKLIKNNLSIEKNPRWETRWKECVAQILMSLVLLITSRF